MENMCTSCSCSKHTCSLKALFLHIKGCDNLCLVGTLLSITCCTFFKLRLFVIENDVKVLGDFYLQSNQMVKRYRFQHGMQDHIPWT